MEELEFAAQVEKAADLIVETLQMNNISVPMGMTALGFVMAIMYHNVDESEIDNCLREIKFLWRKNKSAMEKEKNP